MYLITIDSLIKPAAVLFGALKYGYSLVFHMWPKAAPDSDVVSSKRIATKRHKGTDGAI
jgi:hypothetical protein